MKFWKQPLVFNVSEIIFIFRDGMDLNFMVLNNCFEQILDTIILFDLIFENYGLNFGALNNHVFRQVE